MFGINRQKLPSRRVNCRVFNKKTKEMIYGSEIELSGSFDTETKDEIFMFGTGFRDGNGKEIFEGDIVTFHGPKEDIVEVFWNMQAAAFGVRCKQPSGKYLELALLAYAPNGHPDTRILGNIHQDKTPTMPR